MVEGFESMYRVIWETSEAQYGTAWENNLDIVIEQLRMLATADCAAEDKFNWIQIERLENDTLS